VLVVPSGGDGRRTFALVLIACTGIVAAADDRALFTGAGVGAEPAGGSGLRIFVFSLGSA
jgi:hypothetical protein